MNPPSIAKFFERLHYSHYDFLFKKFHFPINLIMYDRIDMDPTLIILTIAMNFKSKMKILEVFTDSNLN